MKITSDAFQQGEHIPKEYTPHGANSNPPLTFSEVPREAGSLVLIMEDPDAPSGLFTHWLLYDMSPATLQIVENSMPETGVQGTNDSSRIGYDGPSPPTGTHRYFFKLYALDSMLNLPPGASRQEVDTAMKDRTIDSAELMGLYASEA